LAPFTGQPNEMRWSRFPSRAQDKTRKEVLCAQVNLYVALKKWYPAAVVAGYLVKANPENPGTWINLADLVWRAENVEQAETVLLKARDWHPTDRNCRID
jgi:hypothetical protein